MRGTGGNGDVGMIRLDFPGYSGEESLEKISWDDLFRKFDESNLALLVQDERRVEKRAISTDWSLAIQCCKVPGKQASVRARIVVDGALQRCDGAELRELACAPLPLGPAAKKGNRAFVARVIAARTVENRREATIRVLQVRDKV